LSNWSAAARNLLAIRFRGINPDPFLVHFRGLAHFLFHPATIFLVASLLLAGLISLALNGSLFWARLPSFEEFLLAENLLLLALTLMGVKLLHELGHALACHHYNRSCPEMGIMLLFFFPCLYCDVSSTWTIGNKWQRMVVSAAGIYVEMILTAICFWIWWYSLPGLLNSLCFNVVLVCSVGTLLLNGNPLMRYDGYYILADAWEIPNLDRSGRAAWRRTAFHSLLGIRLSRDHVMEPRLEHWAMGYTLLATLYRFTILLGILALFHGLLEPYRMEVGVWGLGGMILGAMVASGVRGVGGTLQDPSLRHRIRWRRFAMMASGGVALLLLIATIPLPYRVHAPATLEFADPDPIYVSVPGRLQHAVPPGVRVAAGEELLVLDNPKLRIERDDLWIERQRFQTRLAALEAQRGDDDEAARRIPTTRQSEADYAHRHRQIQQDIERLTLRSPRSGIVIPPPRQYRKGRGRQHAMAWEGTPLDRFNRGAWLSEGTLACVVGDPERVVAIAVVPQTEIDLISEGQRVLLFPHGQPGSSLEATVIEIAQHPLESAPAILEATGEVLSPKETEADGGPARKRPLITSYQVRMEIDMPSKSLRMGGRMHARFTVTPQSLTARCLRFIRRTFTFG
jgi:putative peptide zinc metalloprotease protein